MSKSRIYVVIYKSYTSYKLKKTTDRLKQEETYNISFS